MSLRTKTCLSGFVAVVLVLLAPATSRAVLLDWNNVTWSSGQLSRSFNVDGTNPGSDVSISITGDTGYLQSGSPNDTTDLTGGQGGSQQSLFLNANWSNRNQSITVAIDFNYTDGVDNVSFMIFDVDYGSGSYRDKIFDIVGIDANGNLVAPTITTSSGNQKYGSGTNQYVLGTTAVDANSGNGNITIDFGSTAIYGLSFSYGNNSDAPNNPGNQYIGLYDISYTKAPPRIPEVHPALASSLVCFLAIGFRRWRARFRGRSTPPA